MPLGSEPSTLPSRRARKWSDQTRDGCLGPDECAVAAPRDEIDVRVALHDAGGGRHGGARPEGGQSVKADAVQAQNHVDVDAIPRRNQHRGKAIPEIAPKRIEAPFELGDGHGHRSIAPELPLAFLDRRMVAVCVPMLDDGRDVRSHKRGDEIRCPASPE